jgi:hypothetical protein
MQRCLNEEAEYYTGRCRKRPIILWIIIFLISLGITLIVLSFKYYDESIVMLPIGMSICLSLVLFVIIPFTLRCLLNTVYYKKNKARAKTRSPLRVTRTQLSNPLASGISV